MDTFHEETWKSRRSEEQDLRYEPPPALHRKLCWSIASGGDKVYIAGEPASKNGSSGCMLSTDIIPCISAIAAHSSRELGIPRPASAQNACRRARGHLDADAAYESRARLKRCFWRSVLIAKAWGAHKHGRKLIGRPRD